MFHFHFFTVNKEKVHTVIMKQCSEPKVDLNKLRKSKTAKKKRKEKTEKNHKVSLKLVIH